MDDTDWLERRRVTARDEAVETERVYWEREEFKLAEQAKKRSTWALWLSLTAAAVAIFSLFAKPLGLG